MNTVKTLLEKKGERIVTIAPHASVIEAARCMCTELIGSVVVVDEQGTVLGIFTERDLMQRVVAKGLTPDKTPVNEVMTTNISCAKLTTTIDECKTVMTQQRLRHLPVVDEGRLVGIISSGDLLAREMQVQQSTIEYLHEFLHGHR